MSPVSAGVLIAVASRALAPADAPDLDAFFRRTLEVEPDANDDCERHVWPHRGRVH